MADTPLIARPPTITDVLYKYSSFTHPVAVLPAIFIGISAGIYLKVLQNGETTDYLACTWLFIRCAEIIYTLTIHILLTKIHKYYPYLFILTEFIGVTAAALLKVNQINLYTLCIISIVLLYDFLFFTIFFLQHKIELTYIRVVIGHNVPHTTCTICLETFKEGDELRSIPCNHSFHSHCINTWLSNHNSCPNCRHIIP